MEKPPWGFLAIDKPAGPTSHDVVDRIRRITGQKTVGHAGTLDPFATGLLIIGIGREATKRLATFQEQEKEYVATARFDGSSDTDDITGTIVPFTPQDAGGGPGASVLPVETASEGSPPASAITAAFASEVGTRLQLPSAYSAKKVGGKKMYELARRGQEIPPRPSEITIRALTVERIAWPDVEFRVVCSSGTYVRAIARDVGAALGTGGYLTALRRTRIGERRVEDAVPAASLNEKNWENFVWK